MSFVRPLPPQIMIAPFLVTESKGHAWFCLQAQPKHEHIAAARLRQIEDIEVFLPRVRFKRPTRLGLAWVTEALFPGYLFARFDWPAARRLVHYASGVRRIVHFGGHVPVISEQIIEGLKLELGPDDVRTISQELSPGDAVQIADGALRGLSAVVTRVLPSRERVAVLMDLLGRQTTVELTYGAMVKEGPARAMVFHERGVA